jgi:hypothetical protein
MLRLAATRRLRFLAPRGIGAGQPGSRGALLLQELVDSAPDFAAFRFRSPPLARVDAESGVRGSVPEPMLDFDEWDAEGDQHAGVAVAEVVKGGVGRCEIGGAACASERLANDFALNCGAGPTGEEERIFTDLRPHGVEQPHELCHHIEGEVDQAA